MLKTFIFFFFSLNLLLPLVQSSKSDLAVSSENNSEKKNRWTDEEWKQIWNRIKNASSRRSPFQLISSNITSKEGLYRVRPLNVNLSWKSDADCKSQLDKVALVFCQEECANSYALHSKVCNAMRNSATINEESVMMLCCPYG